MHIGFETERNLLVTDAVPVFKTSEFKQSYREMITFTLDEVLEKNKLICCWSSIMPHVNNSLQKKMKTPPHYLVLLKIIDLDEFEKVLLQWCLLPFDTGCPWSIWIEKWVFAWAFLPAQVTVRPKFTLEINFCFKLWLGVSHARQRFEAFNYWNIVTAY